MGRSLSERSSPSRPTHDLGWKANVQDTLEPSSGKQTTLNMLVFPTKASMDTSQIAEDIRNGTNTLIVRIYVSQLFGPVTVFSNIFTHAFAFLIFPDRSLSSSSVVLLR